MNGLHVLIQRFLPARKSTAQPQALPVLSLADLQRVSGGVAVTDLPRIGGFLVAPPSGLPASSTTS